MVIEIRRGDELGEPYRARIAAVFVRGFAEDFSSFSKDSERLAEAFAHMLVLEHWRVALVDGHPAAVACFSEGAQEVLAPRWSPMRRALGLLRGTFTYLIVRTQFVGGSLDTRPGLGEIGFVASDPAFRGRGAAKALMLEILAREDSEDFVVLEIKDTNEAALGLYRGVGFVELRRRPARFAGRAGFREYVDMRLAPLGGPYSE